MFFYYLAQALQILKTIGHEAHFLYQHYESNNLTDPLSLYNYNYFDT